MFRPRENISDNVCNGIICNDDVPQFYLVPGFSIEENFNKFCDVEI
jgi:hypothetical protein